MIVQNMTRRNGHNNAVTIISEQVYIFVRMEKGAKQTFSWSNREICNLCAVQLLNVAWIIE